MPLQSLAAGSAFVICVPHSVCTAAARLRGVPLCPDLCLCLEEYFGPDADGGQIRTAYVYQKTSPGVYL